ncbi:MAG: S24/S26 family peptidase [Eubacterium sp.]|nr:S24/S26 family peptidase [Eubacterium sp.]
MDNYSSVREILEETGKYTSFTSGRSMWPLIHHQKDNIIVVAPDGRLKKYDIALYEDGHGRYVLHRVVEVHGDHYIIIGDNCVRRERVTDDMICGVLAGFYKNGKHYVDCRDGMLQKIYARLWTSLYPVRPAILFAERAAGKIKRILKGKKDE